MESTTINLCLCITINRTQQVVESTCSSVFINLNYFVGIIYHCLEVSTNMWWNQSKIPKGILLWLHHMCWYWLLFAYGRSHGYPQVIQQRDRIKQSMCEQNGITLIIIPYWWNKKIQSVAHEISLVRPDIRLPAHLMIGDIISRDVPTQKVEKGEHCTECNHVGAYTPQWQTKVPANFDAKEWYAKVRDGRKSRDKCLSSSAVISCRSGLQKQFSASFLKQNGTRQSLHEKTRRESIDFHLL